MRGLVRTQVVAAPVPVDDVEEAARKLAELVLGVTALADRMERGDGATARDSKGGWERVAALREVSEQGRDAMQRLLHDEVIVARLARSGVDRQDTMISGVPPTAWWRLDLACRLGR